MGHAVLGMDVSPAMVEQASREADRAELADRCRFQCADVGMLDPEAGSFDIIVALGFIEYFDEPKAILSRMRQWLSPAGVLVLQVSNRLRLTYLLDGRSRQLVQRNGAGLLSRQYSPGEIAAAARACGLRRVDYRGHSIGPLKIGGHFLPGYRAAMWLDRRMDQIANLRCCRALGRLGTSFISVFRRTSS
jgi:cyclopropane fatty-acyl-phospholipid synthase-like methyltransferase